MEPIIYKPGAYNTPGIYKGAGGVYNGRGFYNEGAGRSDIHFILDIPNFDLSNPSQGGIDFIISGNVVNDGTNIIVGTGPGNNYFSFHTEQFSGFKNLSIKSKYRLNHNGGYFAIGLWNKIIWYHNDYNALIVNYANNVITPYNKLGSLTPDWFYYGSLSNIDGTPEFEQEEQYTQTSAILKANGYDIFSADFDNIEQVQKDFDVSIVSTAPGKNIILKYLQVDVEF